MYNIYVYEKKCKEDRKKKKERKKQKENEEKKKKRNEILINGYKNRIEQFIYDQIEHPLILSTEKEFNAQAINYNFRPSSPSLINKKFVFNSYQTDHQRINKSFKNDIHHTHSLQKRNCVSNENRNNIIQPNMRFKPRTDLERVFDSVNENYYGKVDKQIIHEQIQLSNFLNQNNINSLPKKIKLNDKTLRYLIAERDRIKSSSDNNQNTNQELLHKLNHIIEINLKKNKDNKNKKNTQKPLFRIQSRNVENKFTFHQKINNSLAKNLLNEYHMKTHFQAASVYSLKLTKPSANKGSFIQPHKKTQITIKKSLSPLYIKIENNPLKEHSKTNCYSNDDLNYIKSLSMNTSLNDVNYTDTYIERSSSYVKKQQFLQQQKQQIIIDNVSYDKNDFPSISKAILKTCNYIPKRKTSQYTSGSGKTSITKGLSVNDFTKKYCLPK